MDNETREALEGSIRKWEKIVEGVGRDEGAENCDLCLKFNTENTIGSCRGCPVREKIGERGCKYTPYDKWVEHHMAYHGRTNYTMVKCEECIALAQKELDFLISLRGFKSW